MQAVLDFALTLWSNMLGLAAGLLEAIMKPRGIIYLDAEARISAYAAARSIERLRIRGM